MVGVEAISQEKGHHLMRERYNKPFAFTYLRGLFLRLCLLVCLSVRRFSRYWWKIVGFSAVCIVPARIIPSEFYRDVNKLQKEKVWCSGAFWHRSQLWHSQISRNFACLGRKRPIAVRYRYYIPWRLKHLLRLLSFIVQVSIIISRALSFLTNDCRFLQVDYYVRPYITGRERVDKVHRPGAQILKVYKKLTEQDALTLTKMPETQQALMRWNASLRNIATIVRNHTSGDLQKACVFSHWLSTLFRISGVAKGA